MIFKMLWQKNMPLLLALWVLLAVIIRPGWPIFGLVILFWVVLLWFTARGSFWNYLATAVFINPGLAEKLLNKAIAADPLVVRPYLNLGSLKARQQRWAEALPLLEKAIKFPPSRVTEPIKMTLAGCYRELGDFKQAIAIQRELAEAKPKDCNRHTALAFSLFKQGDLKEARRMAEKARSLDLGSADPVLIMGRIHFIQKEYTSARDDFEWVIPRLKWPVESHYWLGRAELELGNPAAAAGHLRIVAERLQEDSWFADVTLAEVNEWLSQAEKQSPTS
jgi:tetratricopeptide (TPR) repeat protein